jgi:hypothetical protein
MATIFRNQCLKKQLRCGDSLAQDQKIWQLSSKIWKVLIENWQLFSKSKENRQRNIPASEFIGFQEVRIHLKRNSGMH